MAKVTQKEVQRRRQLFECPDYVPISEDYRCKHYLPKGSCSRDDYFMCVEWVKRNPTYAQVPPSPLEELEPLLEEPDPAVSDATLGASATSSRSTKDVLAEPDESYQPPPERAGERSGSVYDLASLGKVQGAKRIILERPELLTEHAIEQLSSLGYEVTTKTQSGTEVTLVPEYTDKDRAELTYRDARSLVMVLQVFPDATIESLRKPDQEAS